MILPSLFTTRLRPTQRSDSAKRAVLHLATSGLTLSDLATLRRRVAAKRPYTGKKLYLWLQRCVAENAGGESVIFNRRKFGQR